MQFFIFHRTLSNPHSHGSDAFWLLDRVNDTQSFFKKIIVGSIGTSIIKFHFLKILHCISSFIFYISTKKYTKCILIFFLLLRGYQRVNSRPIITSIFDKIIFTKGLNLNFPIRFVVFWTNFDFLFHKGIST
jgi:hypothetical protein